MDLWSDFEQVENIKTDIFLKLGINPSYKICILISFVENWNFSFPSIFQDIKCEVENPKPDLTLAEYLRNTLHLTGTKIACGSSGCGSCTVILSRQAVFEISSHFISNSYSYVMPTNHKKYG